jgi:hypothetical protein
VKQVAARRDITICRAKDLGRNNLHVDDLARALLSCDPTKPDLATMHFSEAN